MPPSERRPLFAVVPALCWLQQARVRGRGTMEGTTCHPPSLLPPGLLRVAGGAESLTVGDVVASAFGVRDDVVGFCARPRAAGLAGRVCCEDGGGDVWGEGPAGTGPAPGRPGGILHGWSSRGHWGRSAGCSTWQGGGRFTPRGGGISSVDVAAVGAGRRGGGRLEGGRRPRSLSPGRERPAPASPGRRVDHTPQAPGGD